MHATSGNELSRVRTEFRLILPSVSSDAYSSREPTLLCNQVQFGRLAAEQCSGGDNSGKSGRTAGLGECHRCDTGEISSSLEVAFGFDDHR